MTASKDLCPACQQPNDCGVASGESSCWCFHLVFKDYTPDINDLCYCQDCLEKIRNQAKP